MTFLLLAPVKEPKPRAISGGFVVNDGGHAQVDNLLQQYQQSGEANNSGIVIPR